MKRGGGRGKRRKCLNCLMTYVILHWLTSHNTITIITYNIIFQSFPVLLISPNYNHISIIKIHNATWQKLQHVNPIISILIILILMRINSRSHLPICKVTPLSSSLLIILILLTICYSFETSISFAMWNHTFSPIVIFTINSHHWFSVPIRHDNGHTPNGAAVFWPPPPPKAHVRYVLLDVCFGHPFGHGCSADWRERAEEWIFVSSWGFQGGNRALLRLGRCSVSVVKIVFASTSSL